MGSVPKVTCHLVQAQPISNSAAVLGRIVPFQTAAIAAKISGTVAALHVKVGQHVAHNEELITLNAREYYANAQQARAQADQAAADNRRAEMLYTQGAITESARDELRNRHRTLQAAAEGAEASAEYTHILAPFDGVITKKMVQTGNLAMPGSILLQLDDLSRYQVEIHVPENLRNNLSVGSTLEVCFEKTSVQAKIVEMASSLDLISRTFFVKADMLSQTECYTGQCVRVIIPGSVTEKLLIPSTSVRRSGALEIIFVHHNERAKMRLIKTTPATEGYVEITGGLEAGERIILQPEGLKDGQRVVENHA